VSAGTSSHAQHGYGDYSEGCHAEGRHAGRPHSSHSSVTNLFI
jgi:hypothetical protein